MKLVLATRKAPLRTTASSAASRYAVARGYDEGAALLALGTTLVAALIVIVCAIVLRG